MLRIRHHNRAATNVYDTTHADIGALSSVSRWKMVRERQAGNSALAFACLSLAFVAILGLSIDISRISAARSALEAGLDGALAAASLAEGGEAIHTAERAFDGATARARLALTRRQFTIDCSGIKGAASATVPMTVSSLVGFSKVDVSAKQRAPLLR